MKTRATQFSRWMGGLMILIAVMCLGVSNTQAQTILTENFDAVGFTTPSTLSPAWSTAASSNANQLWAANNCPTATSGWSGTTGGYTPAGANSTSKSVRFHTYNSSSGTFGELYSPVMDFSTAGEKAVSFYHFNASGTDATTVAISTDGGTTWSASLVTIGVSTTWTLYTIPLGNTTSNNVKIKFRGTSDFGNDDIGIDQVTVFIYNPANYNFTASAAGGLWSNSATWVGGAVPPIGLGNINIPSGSIVTIDQATILTSMSLSGILQWNGTANAMTCSGDFTINSGGKLFPYTTAAGAATGATINIGGNLTNNGYANFYGGYTSAGVLNFNGSGSQTISGTGTFEGDGSNNGYLRTLYFQNLGNNVINTSQNLVTSSFALTGGTLNTNGKLVIDNSVSITNRAINYSVANVAVTTMGAGYTAAPWVGPSGAAAWTSGATLTVGNIRMTASNIYLCTTAGTSGTSAPTHTSGTATATGGTAVFLWVGTTGTIGTAYISTAPTSGSLYFYGDNLYVAVATTAGGTTPPTHTSGTVGSYRYVGSAAKLSVNWDATTGSVRSLNIVNAGSGYTSSTAPTIAIVPSNGVAATTAAVASAVVPYYLPGRASSTTQKSSQTTVSGGLTINSDGGAKALATSSSAGANNIAQSSAGVSALVTSAGGVNYTVAPLVGFAGPTALNLVTNPGSGYSTAPTITVTGGTLISGTALTTSNFTITLNQGKVVSVYLNASTTACYSVPPTLAFSAGTATLAFPTGCWPAATATIGSNGQLTAFTVTNSGYGYVAAPSVGIGTTSATAAGGTFTTVATAPTAYLGVYNLTTNYFTPSTAAGTQLDDAFIPTTRKINTLALSGNANGIKLTSDLTLYGSSPLTLAASSSTAATDGQAGNIIDMGGNNLYFSWSGYAGTTSTSGATNTYLKNGSMTLTTRGGGTTGSTLNYPFLGTSSSGAFSVFTGTGTGAANGADILTVKVSEMGAPSNSTSGGTGISIGKRAFKVETATQGGGAGTAGTSPTVTLHYNMTLASSGPDSLTTTQDQTFVSEAPTLNGAWTVRSTSIGASGALATNASKATATSALGPITLANGSHYAWSTSAPTVTDVAPLSVCANSGTMTITGTNLSGVTGVNIGGVAVTAFTIVSSTQINIVAGAQTSGVITVVKGGAGVSGTQTVTWTGGPSAVSVVATTATSILTGQTVSLSATGSGTAGSEIRWYNQATGGVSLATGDTYTSGAFCNNGTIYAVEYDGSCEGPRTGVAITVIRPTISVSKATFCGVGGNDTLTVTPSDPSITYTWTCLNNAATFAGGVNTGSSVVAIVTATAEFSVLASNAGCSDNSFISVGLYPLPSATVTTTASGVCPGTSATIGSGLSAGNFTATCITPVTSLSTPPANATTLILNGASQTLPSGVSWSSNLDDGKFGPIPMGFNFNFFGVTQNAVNIGTNGVVNFGTYASFSGSQYVFTGGFPNSANPANTIAVCARDLRFGTPAGFGSLRYWTEGIAPNRRFIVQFDNVPIWSGVVTTAGSQSGFNNAEAVFYETLGIIDIRVISATNGTSATAAEIQKYIGLQDGSKTVGATAPNCSTNVANFWNGVTNTIPGTGSQAWRFAPPSNYNILWFANDVQFASGVNLFTQNVAPTVTTLYSITYTNQTTGCTNEPRSAEVNMLVLSSNAPTGVNTVSSVDSTCVGSTFLLSTDYTGLTDGLTYQWQSSTDGGANWSDISGATAITYTASQTAITSYRLKIVSCGGTPEYTTPKTVYFQYFITGVTSALRCGTGTVPLSATSNSNNIRWYDAETGGTPLVTTASFTTPIISTTTVYWAEPRQAGCAGLRVPDTAYVDPAPTLTISANTAAICNGDISSLVTLTAGANDYDVINWTPSTGVSGDVANGWTFNPTTTTTFTLNGSQSAGICAASTSVTITVNAKPAIDSVTANNSTVCAGTSVNLTAYAAGLSSGPQTLPTGYCAGNTSTNTGDEQITSVTFGSMTNTPTDDCSANYTDFSGTVAAVTVTAGQSVPFSVLTDECDGATYFSSGMSIFIDYNRNGTFDANEKAYTTTSTTVSPNTRSGNITIPLTASAGLTKMRVVVIESNSSPDACSSGYGEAEDYAVNIIGVATIDPALTYTWTPGDLVGSAQTVTPTTTTTYTVVASNPTTGCVGTVTGTKTITVNQLPSAPEVSNSEQCGNGVPACFATGTTNGNYRWYLTSTGGTALAGETNNTLSSYSISTTTTFYVAITDGTCESNRVAVTASVTQPDAVTATVDNNNVCANTAITLTANQTGTTNTYSYSWAASPASGSGIATTESGSTVSITPTVAGSYTYTVTATDATAGCVTTSTVSITVKALPTFTSYSATPSTICAGDSVTLAANKTAVTTNNAYIGLATDASGNLSSLSAYGMYFSTVDAATINTVDVYPSVAGTLTIQLKNASGTVVDTKNITIAAGEVSNVTPKTVTLNFSIPAGSTGWQIYHTTSIYRGGGSYAYPSTANGFSITGNTLDGNNITSGTRYYFYNWNVSTTSSYDATSEYSWTWNPGGYTTATARVAPSSSTVYTVTMTDASTSCSNSATVNVTVNPVPTAPTATGSEQCGAGIPAATVASNSGAATPTYKWYTAAVGGSPVQTGTSNTYTSSINATTTFYVSEISDAGCEGPRAEVLATVNQPDAIELTTTAVSNALCLNGSFDISAAYSPLTNLYDTYELTATPASGSGVSGTVTLTVNGFGTDAYTVTPTVAGTYTYTITAYDNSFGCATQSSVTITVNSNPVITSATASASTICAGDSVTFAATIYNTTPGVIVTGTETNLSSASSYPTAFENYWYQSWQQYIYRASELTALGLGAGNLTSLNFNIAAVPSPVISYTDYTIKIGNASANTASTTFQTTGLTTVYGPGNVSPVVGLNTITFATPYNWDGVSDIIVDIRQTGQYGSANATTYYTTTGYNSVRFQYSSTNNSGFFTSNPTATPSTSRPNLTFAGTLATNVTSNYNWTWNPGGATGATVRVAPAASANYTATATNPTTGCSATSANIAITVNPLPAAPVATSSIQCGVGIPTASVTSGDATATPNFSWFTQPTGGTAVQTGTSATYTSSLSVSDTFYVAEISAAGCEGPRSEVIVTVNQPDALVASSANVCLGASVNLTATVTSIVNNNNYTLTWSAASAASGISGSVSGGTATFGTPATTTVTPSAAGTYTFTLNGVDGACSASSSVSVVVNPNPIVTGVSGTPTSICAGSSVSLTGASVISANGSVTTGTGTTLTSATSYPTIFENYYYQTWQQFIYRASELTALGLGAGNISSISFNVGALPSPVITYTDYTVSIGASTANTASTTFQTSGLNTVYGPGNIVPTTGTNTITFATPYNWDGVSDIILDIKQTGQYGDANATTLYTTTAYNSVRYARSLTNNTGYFASLPAATPSTSRPNMTLNGVLSSNVANTYNWSWTGGFNGNPATATNVTTNTDFYGTATNPTTGCSTTSSTAVSVTVVPVSATATSSVTGFSCAGSAVTLTANPVGQGPFTYQWSAGATNLGTAATQSVSPTATTEYTVTVRDVCNNPTTANVTVNVNALPTASIAETSPAALCAPSTQTLTAVPSVSTVTYQWMLNGTNISGATASTYNATASGTYTVKVTDTTIACTSAPSAGFVLNLYPQPIALAIAPASTTICNGQSASLSVTGGTVTTNNVVALAENFDNNAPTWSITSNGVGANTQPWIYRSAPFTLNSGAVVFNAFSTPQGGKFPLVNADAGGTGSTTNSTIESPVFNTSNFTSATLTFEQVFRRKAGDVAKVQISTNGGSTWADLASYTASQGTTTASAQVATTTSITLTAAYLNQSNLKLRFNYSSGYGFFWLVDNVRISGTTVENYTYNWTPSGSLSAATGASVTATPSETTTYTVAVTTQNGCTRSNTVTVNVNPRPTASISGGAAYCANQNTATALSIAVTGAGPWSGTLSNGQSFSGSSSPISVTVTPTATTTYTVATLSDANCTAIAGDLSGSATVNVNPNSANPVLSIIHPTCATATGTITVTAPTGAGYTYSIGGAYQSSNVFSGLTPGNYSIQVATSTGCAALVPASATVNAQPFIPSATTTVVTGQTNVCNLIGTNATTTYVASAAGATTYTWTLPANTQLVSGQGTNTITVKFLSGFAQQANRQIRVTPSSVCGNSGYKIYYLSAQLPGTPGQIVASTSNVCPSLGTNVPITYRIPKVMGAAYYQWTAQNGTTSITNLYSGENDTAIAVTFTSNFSSSAITVQAFNDCGVSGVRSLTVYRNDPSTPGLISGPANACEYIGANGQTATYTVAAIAGVETYTWTLPQGATNVSGQGTNSISFKYPAGYTGGSISVISSNGCGTSGSRSLSISVLAPSYPGQIDVINLSACPNRSYSYTVAGLPSNATSLQWTVPAGGTIVSGQGTNSIVVNYASTVVAGNVSVVAVNNCGTSLPRRSEVKLASCPTGFAGTVPNKGETTLSTPSEEMSVKVFPNPTTSNFNLQVITAGEELVKVRVLDVQGRFIKEVKVQPYQTVNMGAELKAGTYMIEVRQGSQVKTTRVLKF